MSQSSRWLGKNIREKIKNRKTRVQWQTVVLSMWRRILALQWRKKWEPGPITKVRFQRPKYYNNWAQTLFYYASDHVRPRIGAWIRGKLQYKIIIRLCHCLWNWFFVWTAPRMQEIAFLSLRKSKIFRGACPQTSPHARSVLVNQKS
jgi:hypothetical protein